MFIWSCIKPRETTRSVVIYPYHHSARRRPIDTAPMAYPTYTQTGLCPLLSTHAAGYPYEQCIHPTACPNYGLKKGIGGTFPLMLHPGLSITGKTHLYQPFGVVFSALAHGRRYGDWREELCCRLQNFCVNRGALPSKCPRPSFLREGHKRRQSSRHSKKQGRSDPSSP